MIDISNLKAPGWQRVVNDLSSPAPDDRAFLLRLLTVLHQVSGARQAVLFEASESRAGDGDLSAPEVQLKAVAVWPLAQDVAAALSSSGRPVSERDILSVAVDEARIEALSEVKAAVRGAISARQTRVFGLEKPDDLYDGSAKGYVLAAPIPGGQPGEASAPMRSAIAMLLDGRSRQALQTTLALIEVLIGYVYGHAAQQQLGRIRSASAALDLAARLIAAINSAQTFKGAALQLVNDITRQLGADRAAMGWVDGGRHAEGKRLARCIALSDTENIDRRMAMVQKLESAMDECLDQEQPVMYPPPAPDSDQADVLLSQAVVHAHRELAASDARLRVVSLPLRVEQRVLGVLLVESTEGTRLDIGAIELLQAALDLVSPVLEIRRSDDRNLALRAVDSSRRAAAWLVGPRHTGWKVAGVALMLATLASIFIRVPYRVSAPMTIEPREPRTVSVPFDGVIRDLGPGIEPGAKVEKGQMLAQLDTTELELNVLDAKAALLQAVKQADEALKKNDLAEYQQATAKGDQSRAKIALLENRLARAKVTAPLSGVIIAGDLRDKVGASVQTGQALFQIADLADMTVVAKVDDRDIALIRPDMTGQIATKADPAQTFDFTVERIVPLSEAQEGKNAFQVRARLLKTAPWFRPGMEGQAKFNAPERSLLGIASRRIVDQLRLWLWW